MANSESVVVDSTIIKCCVSSTLTTAGTEEAIGLRKGLLNINLVFTYSLASSVVGQQESDWLWAHLHSRKFVDNLLTKAATTFIKEAELDHSK